MTKPLRPPNRANRLAETAKKGRTGRNAPPCADPIPDAPGNVILLFDTVEKSRYDRIRARVTWDEVILNEDLTEANVRNYVVQLQSSDDGIVWSADRIRRRSIKAREFDEVQRITLSSFGTGDSFKLTFGGDESVAITYGKATVTKVKSALEALASIGDGNVMVSGQENGPYRVRFSGDLAGTNVGDISVTSTVGCSGSVETIEQGDGTPDYVFHNIKKHLFYRARVKAISWAGCKGDFSDWTAGANPNDDTSPADPTGVTLDVDEHRHTIKWDYGNEEGDADLLDEDVAYFVVQMSETANAGTRWDAGNIIHKDRTVSQHRSFKAEKPGSKTFYARVMAVDSSRNKSNWVETNATKTTPTQPAAPTVTFDTKGTRHSRYRAIVTVATVSATDREIERYRVKLVHKTTHATPTTGDKREYRSIPGDATGDELDAIFKNIPKHHYVYASTRARDTQGKASTWSDWTDAGRPIDATTSNDTPAAPTGVTVVCPTLRRVEVTWTEPATDELVSKYKVEIYQGTTLKKTRYTRAQHYRYTVPDADKGLSHNAKVYSVDDLGVESAAALSGAVLESGDYPGGDPPPGSIDDLAMFGPSFRPTAIVTHHTGVALPATNYPVGSLVYCTTLGKLFRNVNNVWSAAVNGGDITGGTLTAAAFSSVEADKITVNQIQAGTITAAAMATTFLWTKEFRISSGGSFTTGTTGSYITIDSSAVDAIRFTSGSPSATVNIRAVNQGIQFALGENGKLGFWGANPVAKAAAITGARSSQLQNIVQQLLNALQSYGMITNSTTQ